MTCRVCFSINQILIELKTCGKLEMIDQAFFHLINLKIAISSFQLLNQSVTEIEKICLFLRFVQMYLKN